MSNSRITADELILCLLHRECSDFEHTYWEQQILNCSLESVIRRITSSAEHQRFNKDRQLMFVPAGHFYSPIVDTEFIASRADRIFGEKLLLAGIDLHEASQKEFAKLVVETSANLPFQDQKTAGLRYFYDNGAFVYGDAVVYAAMLKKHRPANIIEIGSGYSSALALDVIDMTDNYFPNVRLYDPYSALVESLLIDAPYKNLDIVSDFIQNIPLDELSSLNEGDFYFMDTTHIVKTGSDVLYHFEEVLPRLKSGVIIHVHDVFYPFEYPESWVMKDKLSWNELYYFRAFIANNPLYEILYFCHYITMVHPELLNGSVPCKKNGGASIWLRKI